MFENLTYQRKCIALFGGFILFLFIGYKVTFSDTFELQSEIKEKEKKLAWLKEKEKELPSIKARMKEFERAYSAKDSSSVRDKLTAYISDYADKNNCLVTEIPVNSSFKNDNLNVQTNIFTVKGSFHPLLKLMYNLETNQKYVAKIMSSRFYTIRDMQAKKKNLYLTIVAQSFQQKNK